MPFKLNPALKGAIQAVATVGQMLWQKGWAEKNAGNLSWDVTGLVKVKPKLLKSSSFREQSGYPSEMDGRSLLITGTGTRFRDIEKNPEACLCVLRFSEKGDGYHILWGGKRPGFRPTSELSSHVSLQHSLLKGGGKLKVVLHTHPDELVALTHLPETNNQNALNWALWGMIPEVKLFVSRGVGLVPYRLAGTDALAQATVEVLNKGYKVAVWETRGLGGRGRPGGSL